MSILRSVVSAGLLCSAVSFAQTDVDLTAAVVIDDFNDAYGDVPNQTCIGAVHGIVNCAGSVWGGQGYWYIYTDAGGSEVLNGADETIVASSNEVTMVPDSSLHVKINTSKSTASTVYAGVGCNFAGDGSSNNIYLDFSKMTSISVKVKGTGSVRIRFETKDIEDLALGWGWYGYTITLTSAWTTVKIPVANLKPETGSKPATSSWTFSHGASQANKLAFQVPTGTDADFYVDDIVLEGITYQDLGLPAAKVLNFKTSKQSQYFSVNGSTIALNLPRAQDVTLMLTDAMGNCVKTLFTGVTSSKTITLDDSKLSSGHYFVVAKGKNVNFSEQIVISK